ncbi:ATP-binding protein [Streptomyces sp. NPDC048281]|uniref:ATP-binding protein n=1 Tax=Streptomyces sp. NPDC048281 TaxID=3154715 RepID=UPI00342B7F2C
MTSTTTARPRQTGHPGYELELERTPQAAVQARSLVRATLACWNLEEHTDSGVLLISELVANAVRHAHGPLIWVHVERPAATLLYFAVVDRAPELLPCRRTPGPDALSGRGLHLLDGVADRWGYDAMDGAAARRRTKRVWAELRVTPSNS